MVFNQLNHWVATIKQFSGDVKIRAKDIKKLHENMRLKIEKQNEKYI